MPYGTLQHVAVDGVPLFGLWRGSTEERSVRDRLIIIINIIIIIIIIIIINIIIIVLLVPLILSVTCLPP